MKKNDIIGNISLLTMPTKINWTRIFKIANIDEEKFNDLGLDKQELSKIYQEFALLHNDLEALALFFCV